MSVMQVVYDPAPKSYAAAARENSAYHYALEASLSGRLQSVGSVRTGSGTYKWQLAFTPYHGDAIIVETFRPSTEQGGSLLVFWLMDWRLSDVDRSERAELAARAQAMEQQHGPSPSKHDVPAGDVRVAA